MPASANAPTFVTRLASTCVINRRNASTPGGVLARACIATLAWVRSRLCSLDTWYTYCRYITTTPGGVQARARPSPSPSPSPSSCPSSCLPSSDIAGQIRLENNNDWPVGLGRFRLERKPAAVGQSQLHVNHCSCSPAIPPRLQPHGRARMHCLEQLCRVRDMEGVLGRVIMWVPCSASISCISHGGPNYGASPCCVLACSRTCNRPGRQPSAIQQICADSLFGGGVP